MSRSTDRGYGFEYINVITANRLLGCAILTNTQTWLNSTGTQKFNSLTPTEQHEMQNASESLMQFLQQYEPWVTNTSVTVERIKSQGGTTDVTDILFRDLNPSRELGISLKSNHEAVKHQRVSPTIDIAQEWLGVPTDTIYMNSINGIFANFLNHCNANNITEYSQLSTEYKDNLLYRPVCEAVAELLDRVFRGQNGAQAISHFLTYLIGSRDFYKAIADFRERELRVISFNLRNTLGVGRQLRTPQRCLDISVQIGARSGTHNRVHIILDNGWELNLRAHNASSRVENSLKWDTALVGIPNNSWQTRIRF